MATKKAKPKKAVTVSALPEIDPKRMKIAIMMVADLFGGGKIPKPGTNISKWTKQVTVQIAWSAKLNASKLPAQGGCEWNQVYASEIGGCVLIEDLVGLVYSKLEAPSGPELLASAEIEAYAALLLKKGKTGGTK